MSSTARIEVISNSKQPLGSVLGDELHNAGEFLVATAFLNSGGLSIIEDKLRSILRNDGYVSIIHGADFRITDPAAIRTLVEMRLQHKNMSYLVNRDWTLTHSHAFHPKLYLVSGDYENYSAIVGSSNLTRGGLLHNTEINVLIRGNSTEPPIHDCLEIYESLYQDGNLVEPDMDFADKYDVLHRQTRDTPLSGTPPENLEALYRDLDRPGFQPRRRLPRSQVEYVVQALANLTIADDVDYVHLSSIYIEVEWLARDAGEQYDWNTFNNSVRGRLNEHTAGVPNGRGLFERHGGLSGRLGEYRLTERGRVFAMRFRENNAH